MTKSIYLLTSLILILFSCKSKIKFESTTSGLEYHFVHHSDTAVKSEIGDALVLNMQIFWNDSLLFDTRELGLIYRIQLLPPSNGSLHEALAMMNNGDSAIFRLNAFNFYQITAEVPSPSCIKKDDKLTFYIRLIDILTAEDIKREQDRIDRMKQKNELSLLQDYLQANEITTQPLPNGLYYIPTKEGTGRTPKQGDSVTVHYEGKFINNQPFDSSLKNNKPFTFMYGDTTLISGWTQGIGLMKKGGVAQIIIPSSLGYGKNGAGYVVPPYSTLIFDIYLLEIKSN
ncbi:MAG: FKBP-type peptidyl-prolyl cis-trans isomerase [Bacteroidales bacterium]|nr:FKBP-type peptidyl-prolyl cis-trans isomerase [Bacteroidales bacterium]